MSETQRTGQQLGRYRLTRLIGQGTQTEVYLAEDIVTRHQAAVKFFDVHMKPDQLEVFLERARQLVFLEEPHILSVFDAGMDETSTRSTPFVAMKYAVGGSLRQRHPAGQIISLEQVVRYVQQLA